MKIRTILAIAAILVLSSCIGGQTNFNIKATGAAGGTVDIIDLLSGEILASGMGDEIVVSGRAAKLALLGIQKHGDDWQTLVFNDGKPIEVDVRDHSIKASPLNERVTDIDLGFSKKLEKINALAESLDNLSEEESITKSMELQSDVNDYFGGFLRLLEENRDNLVPVAFMSSIFSYLDESDLEGQFEPSFAYSKHPYTVKHIKMAADRKLAEEAAEAAAQGLIGTKFLDLEEPDPDGKMHKLSEYVGTGNWVLIDFWASWCGPCRREMPNVVAAYKKYHAKGFDIVGLSFDKEKEDWVKAIADLDMPWHHLSDLQYWQSIAAQVYGIRSIPSSLLVNPEGIIVARDLRGPDLGLKLAAIFGE